MIKFICYPKCTTCGRAKKWLDDNKIDYELRDIKLDKKENTRIVQNVAELCIGMVLGNVPIAYVKSIAMKMIMTVL